MKDSETVLIVGHEGTSLRKLADVMQQGGYDVTKAATGTQALKLIGKQTFDLLLTDLQVKKVDGLQFLKACRRQLPDAEVIVVTAVATTESVVMAMKEGAFHCFSEPLNLDEVRQVAAEAMAKVQCKRENQRLREQVNSFQGRVKIITQDAHMQRLMAMARQIGPTGCNVLITGESGTGKELFARYLHERGGRQDGPFVAINCGAFNEDLLANELFGNEKGAFTGALGKPGLIETANRGTLFLDEVTEMSTAMQVKLLRVIQEREVLRLGGTLSTKVDIRLCAATNRDVAELVKSGGFRQDLYFRLNVVNLHIPPLSERREDIPLLAYHFLNKYAAQMQKDVTEIASQVLDLLEIYPYPGNVRELENIIERAVALCVGRQTELDHLPEHLQGLSQRTTRKKQRPMPSLEERERDYIQTVLRETGGNQTLAAQILGIDRVSLWRKQKRYNLERISL
jgi:DNA-binding NtrC family response regulator